MKRKKRMDAGLHPAFVRIRIELCASRKGDQSVQVYLSRSLSIKIWHMSYATVVRSVKRMFRDAGFIVPVRTANLGIEEKKARERMFLDMPEEIQNKI